MYWLRLIVVDESECLGFCWRAEDAAKLGRLGTSLGVEEKEEILRYLLVSGDFRGVLPVDIGLGGLSVGAAGGVASSEVFGAEFLARAGVAWGLGLGTGAAACFPCSFLARSTIACTDADTGVGVQSPRFPMSDQGLRRTGTRIKSRNKRLEQCSNQGLVDVAFPGLVRNYGLQTA